MSRVNWQVSEMNQKIRMNKSIRIELDHQSPLIVLMINSNTTDNLKLKFNSKRQE